MVDPSPTPSTGTHPKSMRIVVLTCAVVLAGCLVCGGPVGGGAVWYANTIAADMKRDAAHWADKLAAGDYAAAYEDWCAEFRAMRGRDEYAANLAGEGPLARYEITGVELIRHRDAPVVRMRMFNEQGQGFDHDWPMRYENGQWRICRLHV